MGLIRLSDLPGQHPEVAAALVDRRWTRAAEEALLAAGTRMRLRKVNMPEPGVCASSRFDFGAERGRTVVGPI
jgi:hypothetical protein